MRREIAWSLVIVLLAGCPGGDDDDVTANDDDATGDDDDATGDDDDSAASEDCGDGWSVVTFPTDDGQTLEADWRPGSAAGNGAAVLFHMNPANNDRTNYPLRVRDALAATGFAVLNVDRRGAGGSSGAPADAVTGDGARLDMEAAVRFLLDPGRPCGVDRDKLVLIGASNGTTSVYDYTLNRAKDLPFPAANIFLSAGEYTATNNPFPVFQDEWGISLSFPFLWLYPTNEPYSNGFVPDAPGAWRFVEQGMAHGTNMFDGGSLETDTVNELVAWLEAVETPLGDDDDSAAGDDDDSGLSDVAPSDNDTFTAPQFDVNFQGSGAPNGAMFADAISAPTGDTEDWIGFRTPSPQNPTLPVDFELLCATAAAPTSVQLQLWDNDGASPFQLPSNLNCASGTATWTLESAHDYLLRVWWSPTPPSQQYADWTVTITP